MDYNLSIIREVEAELKKQLKFLLQITKTKLYQITLPNYN